MSLDRRSFTLVEFLIAILIISIMAGGVVVMMSNFSHRQTLDISADSLAGDLKQTQQFARVQRDGYKYYGLRFFGGIGVDDDNDGIKDRQGWKIIRYDPPVGISPGQMDAGLGHLDLDRYTVIKGSEAVDNPELLENTYFAKDVILFPDGAFQVCAACPIFYKQTKFAKVKEFLIDAINYLKIISAEAGMEMCAVVFTPEGSATFDGVDLLFEGDNIVLFASGRTKTISITPLTGHVKIE